MSEREQVISKIEEEIRLGEYWDETYRTIDLQLLIDVLALLKEPGAVEPIDIIDEKYPVGDNNRYKGYRCGKCKEVIPWDANYCLYCGRKVNWDD